MDKEEREKKCKSYEIFSFANDREDRMQRFDPCFDSFSKFARIERAMNLLHASIREASTPVLETRQLKEHLADYMRAYDAFEMQIPWMIEALADVSQWLATGQKPDFKDETQTPLSEVNEVVSHLAAIYELVTNEKIKYEPTTNKRRNT